MSDHGSSTSAGSMVHPDDSLTIHAQPGRLAASSYLTTQDRWVVRFETTWSWFLGGKIWGRRIGLQTIIIVGGQEEPPSAYARSRQLGRAPCRLYCGRWPSDSKALGTARRSVHQPDRRRAYGPSEALPLPLPRDPARDTG